MPTISSKELPPNVSKLLKQATIDLSNPAYGDIEFSKYTFSALKALEGVLKYNLCKCKIVMKSTSFTMFDKTSNGIYKLQEAHSKALTIDEVENLKTAIIICIIIVIHLSFWRYNRRNRRKYTHVEYKKEANDIIKSTLKVIDTNYIE